MSLEDLDLSLSEVELGGNMAPIDAKDLSVIEFLGSRPDLQNDHPDKHKYLALAAINASNLGYKQLASNYYGELLQHPHSYWQATRAVNEENPSGCLFDPSESRHIAGRKRNLDKDTTTLARRFPELQIQRVPTTDPLKYLNNFLDAAKIFYTGASQPTKEEFAPDEEYPNGSNWVSKKFTYQHRDDDQLRELEIDVGFVAEPSVDLQEAFKEFDHTSQGLQGLQKNVSKQKIKTSNYLCTVVHESKGEENYSHLNITDQGVIQDYEGYDKNKQLVRSLPERFKNFTQVLDEIVQRFCGAQYPVIRTPNQYPPSNKGVRDPLVYLNEFMTNNAQLAQEPITSEGTLCESRKVTYNFIQSYEAKTPHQEKSLEFQVTVVPRHQGYHLGPIKTYQDYKPGTGSFADIEVATGGFRGVILSFSVTNDDQSYIYGNIHLQHANKLYRVVYSDLESNLGTLAFNARGDKFKPYFDEAVNMFLNGVTPQEIRERQIASDPLGYLHSFMQKHQAKQIEKADKEGQIAENQQWVSVNYRITKGDEIREITISPDITAEGLRKNHLHGFDPKSRALCDIQSADPSARRALDVLVDIIKPGVTIEQRLAIELKKDGPQVVYHSRSVNIGPTRDITVEGDYREHLDLITKRFEKGEKTPDPLELVHGFLHNHTPYDKSNGVNRKDTVYEYRYKFENSDNPSAKPLDLELVLEYTGPSPHAMDLSTFNPLSDVSTQVIDLGINGVWGGGFQISVTGEDVDEQIYLEKKTQKKWQATAARGLMIDHLSSKNYPESIAALIKLFETGQRPASLREQSPLELLSNFMKQHKSTKKQPEKRAVDEKSGGVSALESTLQYEFESKKQVEHDGVRGSYEIRRFSIAARLDGEIQAKDSAGFVIKKDHFNDPNRREGLTPSLILHSELTRGRTFIEEEVHIKQVVGIYQVVDFNREVNGVYQRDGSEQRDYQQEISHWVDRFENGEQNPDPLELMHGFIQEHRSEFLGENTWDFDIDGEHKTGAGLNRRFQTQERVLSLTLEAKGDNVTKKVFHSFSPIDMGHSRLPSESKAGSVKKRELHCVVEEAGKTKASLYLGKVGDEPWKIDSISHDFHGNPFDQEYPTHLETLVDFFETGKIPEGEARNFGDPMVFIRNTINGLEGLTTSDFDQTTHNEESFRDNGVNIFEAELKSSRQRSGKSGRFEILVTYDPESVGASTLFKQYMQGKSRKGVRPIREFDLDQANFSDFFGEDLFPEVRSVWVTYDDPSETRDIYFGFEISTVSQTNFKLEKALFSTNLDQTKDSSLVARTRELFNADQIEAASHPKDFRPWVHRALEIASGLPKEQWHDPSIYSLSPTKIKQAHETQTVNSLVDILFTGDEQTALQEQLQAARLKTGRWAVSVPKLSLGPITLPAPKGRDASQDALMISGAPLFVEQASQLGIMDEQQALTLLQDRLVQHYIHSTQYQLGVEQAREVIARLEDVLQQIDQGLVSKSALAS